MMVKEDIKSRVASMKERLGNTDSLSGEEFSNNGYNMENLQKDGDVQDVDAVLDETETEFDFDDGYVDEDEMIWDQAYKYFESGNVEDLKTYKELGGNMSEFLQSAIEKGKLKFVKDAIENGAGINDCYYNPRGISMAPSLVTAARQVAAHNELTPEFDESRETQEQVAERREIVKYLIRQGANLDGKEDFISPLQAVCGINGYKDYETYKILVKAGAPLTTYEVSNALHDSKLFDILTESGYKPTADVLSMVIDESYHDWTSDNRDIIAVMNDIVKVSPEVIKELDTPENPIMLRVKQTNVGQWLMQHGADMTHAAENPIALENLEYLKAVVENGADVTNGKILRKAVEKQKSVWQGSGFVSESAVDKEMVKFLIEKGSNVNCEETQNLSVSGRSTNSNTLYKTNTLMSYIGCHKTNYDSDVVQMLVNAGADVNYVAKQCYEGDGNLSMTDVCLDGCDYKNVPEKRLELFEQLMSKGMKPYERDVQRVVDKVYNIERSYTYPLKVENEERKAFGTSKDPRHSFFGEGYDYRGALPDDYTWKEPDPKCKKILDIMIQYDADNVKNICSKLVEPYKNTKIVQDLKCKFQKANTLSKLKDAQQKAIADDIG